MTDRGLNIRLRQRSRRAGLMIGVSMAVTIALCVAGFSVIYSALDGFTSDFVSDNDPTVQATTESQIAAPGDTPQPTDEAGGAAETDETDENAAGDESGAEGSGDAEPTATAAETGDNQIQPTGESGTFTPDYQNSAGQTVTLRAGPGVRFDRITSLTPAQALQYLGESQQTENPGQDMLAVDDEWMMFRTEDGEEGWVREIDVEPYDPGD